MSESASTTYDQVLYHSEPFARTQPICLEVIATLFGMQPAPASRCRVLELGCGNGANIYPLAASYPECKFTGIDLAARQIDAGREIIRRLALTNIELINKDLLEVDRSLGEFDYIIAHGLLSWVPKNVQKKIFQICGELLAPQGIAYLSYNTYPGWHSRKTIREIMLYGAQSAGTQLPPREYVEKARATLKSVTELLKLAANPANQQLLEEIKLAENMPAWYLFHDFLSPVNDPFYFHEIVSQASEHGLQYLGDSEVSKMTSQDLKPEVQELLGRTTRGINEREQHLDFIRNRSFRRTLLCRAAIPLNHRVKPELVRELYCASALNPAGQAANGSERFCAEGGGELQSADPALCRALRYLREQWPAAVKFDALIGYVQSTPEGQAQRSGSLDEQLAHLLLRGFLANLTELYKTQPPVTRTAGTAPVLSPVVREEARLGRRVCNLLHERVELSEALWKLATKFDGTRRVEELQNEAGTQVNIDQLLKEAADKALIGAMVKPQE